MQRQKSGFRHSESTRCSKLGKRTRLHEQLTYLSTEEEQRVEQLTYLSMKEEQRDEQSSGQNINNPFEQDYTAQTLPIRKGLSM